MLAADYSTFDVRPSALGGRAAMRGAAAALLRAVLDRPWLVARNGDARGAGCAQPPPATDARGGTERGAASPSVRAGDVTPIACARKPLSESVSERKRLHQALTSPGAENSLSHQPTNPQ